MGFHQERSDFNGHAIDPAPGFSCLPSSQHTFWPWKLRTNSLRGKLSCSPFCARSVLVGGISIVTSLNYIDMHMHAVFFGKVHHVCIFSKLDDPIIVIARAHGNLNAETGILKHWSWGIPVYPMFFRSPRTQNCMKETTTIVFLIFPGGKDTCIICSHTNQSHNNQKNG